MSRKPLCWGGCQGTPQGTPSQARAAGRQHHARRQLQLFSRHKMDLTTSESHLHTPHDAGSGFEGDTQPSSALESPRRVGCTLILAHTTYSRRVTQAATPDILKARVASHMGTQQPQSHMVPCSGTQAGTHSYRVTHKRTQSHGHTQSHGRTQARTQAHAPTGHTCSAAPRSWHS